jgi:hypothetical protein
MKIILLQDEKKLGKKGDIIEASEVHGSPPLPVLQHPKSINTLPYSLPFHIAIYNDVGVKSPRL